MPSSRSLVGSPVEYGTFAELARRGVEVHQLPSDDVLRPVAPCATSSFPDDFSRQLGEIPPEYVQLEDVYVFPSGAAYWEGLYFTRELLFLNEKLGKRWRSPPHLWMDTRAEEGRIVIASDLPVKGIKTTTVVATNFRTKNFYHFCHDVVGKIYYAAELARRDHSSLAIAISPVKFAMQRYMLSEIWPGFNITHDHNRIGQLPCIAHYEKAIIVRSPATPTHLCLPALRYVRHKMQELGQRSRGAPRKLYVSRKDGRSTSFGRTVRDEQALLDILAEYEVEPIVVGELSVQEQLALFSSASVIVGVHGAGLTNLLFAPDDSMLIEIGGSPTTNNHYARDAINLGLDYFYVPSRRFESEIEPDFDILRAALEVGDQRLGRAWIN